MSGVQHTTFLQQTNATPCKMPKTLLHTYIIHVHLIAKRDEAYWTSNLIALVSALVLKLTALKYRRLGNFRVAFFFLHKKCLRV